MKCNGEFGKPGSICTHVNITHDTKCPDAVECPGCSVCHGDCDTCGGTGEVEAEEEITHYVTRDMALDACEPDMEGQPMTELVLRQVDCTTYQPTPVSARSKGGKK